MALDYTKLEFTITGAESFRARGCDKSLVVVALHRKFNLDEQHQRLSDGGSGGCAESSNRRGTPFSHMEIYTRDIYGNIVRGIHFPHDISLCRVLE